jgi:hypothetical protein
MIAAVGEWGEPSKGVALNVIEDYRRRAAEVAKLANAAGSEEHRRQILKIAETWALLAEGREKMIKQGWAPRVRRNGKMALPSSDAGR